MKQARQEHDMAEQCHSRKHRASWSPSEKSPRNLTIASPGSQNKRPTSLEKQPQQGGDFPFVHDEDDDAVFEPVLQSVEQPTSMLSSLRHGPTEELRGPWNARLEVFREGGCQASDTVSVTEAPEDVEEDKWTQEDDDILSRHIVKRTKTGGSTHPQAERISLVMGKDVADVAKRLDWLAQWRSCAV